MLVVCRFLDSVPVQAIGYFRASAEKLIEERGAVDALAAALAHISGATSLEQRSLLNSDAVSLGLVWFINTHTKKKIKTDDKKLCTNKYIWYSSKSGQKVIRVFFTPQTILFK